MFLSLMKRLGSIFHLLEWVLSRCHVPARWARARKWSSAATEAAACCGKARVTISWTKSSEPFFIFSLPMEKKLLCSQSHRLLLGSWFPTSGKHPGAGAPMMKIHPGFRVTSLPLPCPWAALPALAGRETSARGPGKPALVLLTVGWAGFNPASLMNQPRQHHMWHDRALVTLWESDTDEDSSLRSLAHEWLTAGSVWTKQSWRKGSYTLCALNREVVSLGEQGNPLLQPQATRQVRACSVMSNSLPPCGLQPARLLCPWKSPGKNTRMGCHALLQGIFPTQVSNLSLLYWRADSLPLSHQGSPILVQGCSAPH